MRTSSRTFRGEGFDGFEGGIETPESIETKEMVGYYLTKKVAQDGVYIQGWITGLCHPIRRN